MDKNLLTKFLALVLSCFLGSSSSMAGIEGVSLEENPLVSEKYMLLKVDQGEHLIHQ